jgi:hypothetical protein
MAKPQKKLNISFRPATAASVILVLAIVGLHIYQLQEIRGLRARVHSLEYARGEQLAEEEKYSQEKVDYEVLEKSQATIRVEEYDGSYDMERAEPRYVEKQVNVYKVKVTNNTSWTYEFMDGDIRGKTANGSLVSPESMYSVHPDDKRGPEALSLAPGGVGEVYVYLSNSQEIVELYYPNTPQ